MTTFFSGGAFLRCSSQVSTTAFAFRLWNMHHDASVSMLSCVLSSPVSFSVSASGENVAMAPD